MRLFVVTIARIREGSASASMYRVQPSVLQPDPASHGSLQVDMRFLHARESQFLEARGSKAGELRKHEVVVDFDLFLNLRRQEHTAGPSPRMETL